MHLLAEFFVERAQWLIQKQHFGLFDQRPSESDTLSLPAREFGGASGAVAGQFNQIEHLVDPLIQFGPRQPRPTHAEGDISTNIKVWKDGVTLKNHIDRPLIGRRGGHGLTIDHDLSLVRHFKTGNHAEQGGFSAA